MRVVARNNRLETFTRRKAMSIFHKRKKNAAGGGTTRITVRFDVGFSNNVFIRGHGAGLSWDQGVLLKNVGPDEWVWEAKTPFDDCEFKVLINDQQYEQGENHHVRTGAQLKYTPQF